MEHIHTFYEAGKGYAWIMLNFNTLSDENKDLLFELEERKGKNGEKIGEKVIWFVHSAEMSGNIEFSLRIGKYDNEENPYTIKSHNLLALAEKCTLELTEEQVEKLQIITQFNISARYDDYKETFNKKCTDEYTSEKIKDIEEVRIWLKSLLIEE